MQEDHWQSITERTITDLDNQIQAILYKNVALQVHQNAYHIQLKWCQNPTHDLITNQYIPCANKPGKENMVMIIEKNINLEENEFYEYSYYMARIHAVNYHKNTMVQSTVSVS